MTRLNHASEILALAERLGVDGPNPINGILDYCHRRIDGWVAEAGGVTDIDALESLVTTQLQLVFEEIRSDEDFDRITDGYARAKKDPVFATMRHRFDDSQNPTYGALVQRRNVTADATDRFVAVIDCRGNKLARRFFTRWHEIAHRLTTHADGGDTEPGYRSEHDPIERMMDEIAAHVGFYGPIFDPAFQQATYGKLLLSFATVESIISGAFPAASFQATLFACARRVTTPLIYLEAKLDHKKEVKRKMATLSLFDEEPPPGELRAVKVIPNKAAQDEGFTIPTNMRVPPGTVIHRLFDAEPRASDSASENLSQWESRGRSLEARVVSIEGRKVADQVIAIVQPVEEKKRQKQQDRVMLFRE